MTSVDFLEKVYGILDDQNFRITFSLAQKKNYMMYCNGKFIGGLFDDELCLVYTDSGSAILNNPEPVYRGYSKNAQHKMLSVPIDHAKVFLYGAYKELFGGETLAYDAAYIIQAYSAYPDDVEQLYNNNVLFLKFCYANGLLKKSPLDRNDRLIRLTYYNKDLTPKGLFAFRILLQKYLQFCDRRGKSDPEKMLKKWMSELEKNFDLNLLYDKSLEFGKHWLRPLVEWARELWPQRDIEKQTEISQYIEKVRDEINEYIYDKYDRSVDKLTVSDENVKTWIRKNYPWMSEENISHAYSQGMYYAWRG